MLRIQKHGEPLEELANRIRLAAAPSHKLIDDIVATTCTRLPSLKAAGKARQFEAWCRSGAWVDVAYALIALESPGWTVRRILRDDGMWLCSLSRSPDLPIEIDDVVEVSHETMPLALLAAFVEARRSADNAASPVKRFPSTASAECHRICCDNFS